MVGGAMKEIPGPGVLSDASVGCSGVVRSLPLSLSFFDPFAALVDLPGERERSFGVLSLPEEDMVLEREARATEGGGPPKLELGSLACSREPLEMSQDVLDSWHL